MTACVIDASMIGAALFPGQFLPGARRIVRDGAASLWAPHVLRQEVVNSAWRLERRGLMARDDVDAALTQFDRIEIDYVDSPDWLRRALATARRFNQPRIFDAVYLVCAEDLDAELWTCDRRFVASFGARRPSQLKLCPEDLPPDSP